MLGTGIFVVIRPAITNTFEALFDFAVFVTRLSETFFYLLRFSFAIIGGPKECHSYSRLLPEVRSVWAGKIHLPGI